MTVYATAARMAALVKQGLWLDHHHYEKFARCTRDVERVGGWQGERLDQLFELDLAVAVYRPTHHKLPVMSFGNTRLPVLSATPGLATSVRQLGNDLLADVDPLGIGVYAYLYNEGSIKMQIEDLVARHDRRVVLTGHSLGGVTAQLAAANLSQYVDSVVTFQSPGTIDAAVELLYAQQPRPAIEQLQQRSFHYGVDGDELIEWAGECYFPGTSITVTLHPDQIGLISDWDTHVKMLFPPFERTRGSQRAIESIVTGNFIQMEVNSAATATAQTRPLLSRALEYLRHVSLPAFAAGLGEVAALALVRQVLYCAVWCQSVGEFLANPERNTRVSTRLPWVGDASIWLTSTQRARLGQEFERYLVHSRLRVGA